MPGPANLKTTTNYNAAGELTSYCPPVSVAAGNCLSAFWSYGRDGFGNVSAQTAPTGSASARSAPPTIRRDGWPPPATTCTPRPTPTDEKVKWSRADGERILAPDAVDPEANGGHQGMKLRGDAGSGSVRTCST